MAVGVFAIAIAIANAAGESSWPVWLGTLVGPLTLGLWQIRQGNVSEMTVRERVERELANRNRELCEANILEALRQAARMMAPAETGARSNVMLVGGDNRLFVAYHFNMADAPDHGLRLDRYQGCAGHAWALGDQASADLQGVPNSELRMSWKLSPAQISLTREIRSMISTPVRDPRNRDAVVGVFSVDSDQSLATTRFDSEETAEEALKVAEVLSRLLVAGGII